MMFSKKPVMPSSKPKSPASTAKKPDIDKRFAQPTAVFETLEGIDARARQNLPTLPDHVWNRRCCRHTHPPKSVV